MKTSRKIYKFIEDVCVIVTLPVADENQLRGEDTAALIEQH